MKGDGGPMRHRVGAVKKRKLSICGGTVLCKPKNGSPFRNLNRRGGSLPRPPLVSVDSLNSLRPKGRSCHWQAGRFAPPLQESCMAWTKAGGLLASPPAKTSKENHTSYRDFSFLAAGDVFFHSPYDIAELWTTILMSAALFRAKCPQRIIPPHIFIYF